MPNQRQNKVIQCISLANIRGAEDKPKRQTLNCQMSPSNLVQYLHGNMSLNSYALQQSSPFFETANISKVAMLKEQFATKRLRGFMLKAGVCLQFLFGTRKKCELKSTEVGSLSIACTERMQRSGIGSRYVM